MNIPDEVIEQAARNLRVGGQYVSSRETDAYLTGFELGAEWARKEALREAAEAIGCEAHGGAADQCALCVNYSTVRALAEAYE